MSFCRDHISLSRYAKTVLQEVYSEACIDPATVEYVEAHGTGTKAGDPQELNTISDVFCKDRLSPLLIGSVKSNMGHPEPASGNIQLLFKLINKMFHEVLNNYYATFIDSLLLWV